MCIFINEMSLFWIVGFLMLRSGVITASNVTAAPGFGTTTSNEVSAFIISIKITNRIYNNSLEDHQSESYKVLRQDVENVFFEIYRFTPSAQYQEIAEMTFSNGSIIANATVLFGSKQKSGQALKDIFVTNYQEHPSLTLALNISHTADHEPIPASTNILEFISNLDSPSTSPNSSTTTDVPSTTLTSASSPTHTSRDINTSTSTTPQSISTTEATKSTNSFSHTISNNVSSSNSSSSTADHPTDTSTVSAPKASTTTMHLSSNTPTISVSSSLSTTVHGANNVSPIPSSTTTVHTSSNVSSMPVSSSTTTVLPDRNTPNMSLSNSSVSPGNTVTQKPTGHEGSDIVATEQGVPGWGIAILVLAAVILFFMLVLLILLLLFWCCWWRQRGFMNVSDPDPTGYYNPDIPMYSTHSTYDSHNGKSLGSDSERTPKNRTGTYKVNK